ncbi:hypothetical protein [Actinoplanes sp. N902-109]|uniref:hypothetical protein n=1 Tax=Actinoplanes sp. (strain N902-109) TaxID=649831 RepID=UPI001E329186|nr:hypothetical protein [Actinoplanes sp. N902-109]
MGRLRSWLRNTTARPGDSGERDYLAEAGTPDEFRAGVAAEKFDAGAAEPATTLLRLARDGDVAARGAVLDALGEADGPWWVALDEALRQRWWADPRWSRRVAADVVDGDLDTLRLVVAGCHHDGRIREAAVVRLADQRHPAAVAVLALRACDWVAEVRQAARTAVTGWSSPPDGPAFTVFAEVAFALGARRAGAWLAGRVEEMLQDLPAPRLGAVLAARDRRVRRAAFRAAIAAGRLDQDRLIEAAIREQDLPIRTMCARVAVAAADAGQLHALLASRTALVRAEALRALTGHGDLAVAEAALTDRHPLVRDIAQSALRRAGVEPAEHYRRLAAQATPAPSVIAGLGETGKSEDGEVVTQWLAHPRARGRVEAIRASHRLGGTRPELVVPLLHDESAAVTRQAVAVLRRHPDAVDPATLWSLLGTAHPPHVRFAGYRLLVCGDVWQRLVTDLRLVEDADQRLRATARADIAAWLKREAATSYRGPSRDRAVELDRLIDEVGPVLGAGEARLLRFHAGLDSTG